MKRLVTMVLPVENLIAMLIVLTASVVSECYL